MADYFTLEQYKETVTAICSHTGHRPTIGIILGSGLGALAGEVRESDCIPHAELPYWPASTVDGHAGQLVVGRLEGHTVLVMQGRSHYYEGYTMPQIGLPVRVMQLLGVHTLVVTNAAGGINPSFRPGDLMLITDHINLIGMGGLNPLRGPNLDSLGVRFPDMLNAYDPELRALALDIASEERIVLQQGVYVSLAGPNFETPADIRFLRAIGTDAVGMSTVPEVIVARHGRIRVLGLSGIANEANPHGTTPTTHEEVIEAGRVIVPKLTSVILGVLRRYNKEVDDRTNR